MKRLKLELAKIGVWGSKENATPLTAEDLKEVAETFKEIKSAPVTLGHTLADFMPAFGWVKGVELDEERGVLYGEVELNDLLAEAVEKGLYQKWSVGIRRRAKDGKRYLHHLAFLGAVPPKIKDLQMLDGQIFFAEKPEEVWIDMSETKITYKSHAKTDWPIAPSDTSWDPDKARKNLVEKGGWKLLSQCCGAVEYHDDEKELPEAYSRYKFPFCDVINGKVMIVPKAVSAGIGYLNGARGVKIAPELEKVVRPILEKIRDRIEKMKNEEKKNAADMEDNELLKLQQELERYKKEIKELRYKELAEVAEGKIPKNKLPLLRVLIENLPLEEEFEFADETGEIKKKTIYDILKEIFKSIPVPVNPAFSFADFEDELSQTKESVSHFEVMDRI